MFNLICWEWPWSSFPLFPIFKSVSLSFNFHRPIGRHAYIGLFSLAWAFCSSLVPSGPNCVSARRDQLNKQTNKPNIEASALINKKCIDLPVQYDHATWIADVPHGEELAFPWLFPSGVNGLSAHRSKRYVDARWRKKYYLPYVCL